MILKYIITIKIFWIIILKFEFILIFLMTEIYGTTKDSVVNLSNFTAELLNTGGVGFNKIIDMEFSDDVKAAEFNFKKGLRMTDTVAKLPIGDRASKL